MTAPIDWNDDDQEQRDPATTGWRAALGRFTPAELRKTQAALAASQADLTAREYAYGRLLAKRAIQGAELLDARKELEKLRPVADAARAYVDSPEPPPLTAGDAELRTWGDEMERRYVALLNAVTRAGAA